MSLEEKLKNFLEKRKDWERKRTTINGVFLLKIPQGKNKPSRIIVEINPTKKRGLILRNLEDLENFRKLLNIEKLEYLLIKEKQIV
ncbi:MAG: hypothetical protein QXO40_03500 [Candidatus Aenigmatarchaeota archaeon]